MSKIKRFIQNFGQGKVGRPWPFKNKSFLTLTRFEFPPCLSANHDRVLAESTNHSIT